MLNAVFQAGLSAYYELLLLVPDNLIYSVGLSRTKETACSHCIPGLNQIKEALLIIHYDILYVILLFIITRVCIINLSFC